VKFSVLVAILAEEMEDRAVDIAKDAGAGALTVFNARGLTAQTQKTFFGLTYEGAQSVLVAVLEKRLSLQVLKALNRGLNLEQDERGIVFTLPLEHLAGINLSEVEQFTQHIQDQI
jgi:hypothetical protein